MATVNERERTTRTTEQRTRSSLFSATAALLRSTQAPLQRLRGQECRGAKPVHELHSLLVEERCSSTTRTSQRKFHSIRLSGILSEPGPDHKVHAQLGVNKS
jgi:hypothetical protein